MCESNKQIKTPPGGEVICGLGALPEQGLLTLHERLGLTMPTAALATCASYYGRVHRDPTVGELLFIDEVVRARQGALVADMTLSQLGTRDESIAKSLHRLLQTHTKSAGKTRPLTLRRALSGTQSCPAVHAPSATRLELMSEEALGTLGARARRSEKSVTIEGTGLCLALTAPERRTILNRPRRDDLITLLTHSTGADENAGHRMQHLLRHISPRLHAACTLRKGMMTDRLLKLCPGGLCTDLTLLQAAERPDLPLSPHQARGCLVCTDESTARALRAQAEAQGLFAITFGRMTGDSHWRVVSGKHTLFSLPLPLLRALTKPQTVCVHLHEHAAPRLMPDDRLGVLVTGDPGQTCRLAAGKPLTLGDLKILHTTLPLDDALSPADLSSALMRAATHLVAAGADASTLQAGIALCAQPTTSPSAMWAAVIGWQRMLRLWELPTLPPVIRSGEQEGSVTVVVFARDVRPVVSTVVESECSMRLFVPALKNGVPDPRELKSLLRLTGKALSEGHIGALCPLWNEPPAKALSRLSGFTPYADHTTSTLLSTPTFGLLVRSDRQLSLGIGIGTVHS